MIIEHEPNVPALRREWLAARLMAGLGAILLIAVVAVAIAAQIYGTAPQQAAPPAAVDVPTPRPSSAEARRQEDIVLCGAALATVQTLGLVPVFAVRDGDESRPAGVQGRYTCNAKTDAAKYAITFDLACTHLGDANCIVPFAIVQDGTRTLYRRK